MSCNAWAPRAEKRRCAAQNFKEVVYPLIALVYASQPMRVPQVFLLAIATASSVLAQYVKPLAERLAAQNAQFDEHYEADLPNFPERATSFGDYRYNARLTEYPLHATQPRPATAEAFSSGREA